MKRIKNAIDNKCELCGQEYPVELLEIHYIPVSISIMRKKKKRIATRDTRLVSDLSSRYSFIFNHENRTRQIDSLPFKGRKKENPNDTPTAL